MASRFVRRSGRRRRAIALAFTVALGILLSSCSSSGFIYVSSSDRNAYFKVPADWKYFDKRDLLVASGQSLSAESNRQLSWLIAYDSDPEPSINHVIQLDESPQYPVVEARVQQLPFTVRDQLSLETMRNWVYPVDRLIQENFANVISYKDVTLPGGLHGVKMTFEVVLGGQGSVLANNDAIWVAQTIVVDNASQKVYLFLVRCDSHCYRDNRSMLDQIVDSWTVKER
jgi:hypothetical protein